MLSVASSVSLSARALHRPERVDIESDAARFAQAGVQHMTRYRIDGTSAAVGIPVAAYMIVLSLFALWFYSLLQPHYTPNPGLAAYKPPPATVIGEMPARR